MRYGTKWFSSALAMAFFAIVALCVSPAFAWSCCCSAQQTIAASASTKTSTAKLANAPHCALPCCEKADGDMTSVMKAANSKGSYSAAHSTVMKSKCDCAHDGGAPVVSAVSSAQSFFGIGVLAMPVQAFTFNFEEDVRFAPCFDVAARPRSPGWRCSSERGPPVFSS